MSSDMNAAEREASKDGFGSGFIAKVAERLGATATARTVFGEPVEQGGVTVIPVARVRYGFGGGGGSGKSAEKREDGEGGGGGGGVTASPVGFIELANGRATFRRIGDPGALVPLVLAIGVAAWLVLRAFRRLVR